ncbi:hypothetical protein C8J57DRAFT_1644522 [Mycena rebaudengoi]|nr:hypothetical protein C8J57DRAFT_1644522 [Mycena rebaudengoi]
MNTFYDKAAAKKSIERLAEHMGKMDSVCVKETGFPECHKAVMKEDPKNQREVTFTVLGMLQDMELPPLKRSKISPSNVGYARQQVSIVGLGADSFNKAMEKIMKVAFKVELAFDDSDVTAWMPQPEIDDIGAPLQASCRYFTTAKDAPANQVMDFSKHVDPSGVLSRMLTKGIFHCVDNEVSYLNLEGDSLTNKNPSGFRVGDNDELGLSVVAFKGARDSKAVIKLAMRSLVFLDG